MLAAEDHATVCVTAALLERNARQWPQLVVLRFDNGEQFTTGELLAAVRARAAGLQALGVQQGANVSLLIRDQQLSLREGAIELVKSLPKRDDGTNGKPKARPTSAVPKTGARRRGASDMEPQPQH